MKIICESCSNNMCAKKVPMFKNLSDKQINEIISMKGQKGFEKGDVICHEGDKTDSLIIINQGKVKLSKIDREGKEQILRILSNGSFFGEYYLLSWCLILLIFQFGYLFNAVRKYGDKHYRILLSFIKSGYGIHLYMFRRQFKFPKEISWEKTPMLLDNLPVLHKCYQ